MPMTSTSGASCSGEPVLPGAPGNVIGICAAAAVSGRADVALTPVTPGIAASARSTRSWNPTRSGGFGKNSGGLRTRKVRRPSGLNPGSARSRCSTLRTTSPALLRSTSESATCVTIIAATHAAVAAASPHGAAREQRRQRGACRPDRGHRRGEQPEQHAERGHPDDNLPVHGDRLAARKVERRQRDERARRPDGDQCARRAADQTEQAALEQRRAHDGEIAGAERARHRELVLALRRAREQHRREVDHQHQREERAGGPEDEERGPRSGDDVGFEADGIELQAAAVEVAGVDRPAGGVDGGRHGLRRRAGPRPEERRKVPAVAWQAREIDGERDERVDALRRAQRVVAHECKRRRQDADDRVRIALEPHLRADERGIGAEPVPERVRQHDQVRAAAARLHSARSRARASASRRAARRGLA